MAAVRKLEVLSRRIRSIILIGAVLLTLGAVVGGTVRVPYRTALQSAYAGHVGEIHGVREVGQTFISLHPFLSGVAFQTATYSNRKATGEVLFELRRNPGDSAVLRTVRVPTSQFRDHEWYTFTFPPIADSREQAYYASLRSSTSRPGDAITLDFSADNPYVREKQLGLFLFRDGQRTPEAIQRAEKSGADLAFALFHRISLWERTRIAVFDAADFVRRETRRVTVLSLAGITAAVLAVTTLAPSGAFSWLARRSAWRYALATLLLFLAIFFRVQYAQRLPVTNDEGSMLYDAWAFSKGRLPGGDGVLKTPTVVQALAAALRFFPQPTLLVSRYASILAGVLALAPLLVLARAGRGERGGSFRIAGLWLLAAAPAIFSVYLHAQPLQLFLLTSGLALFARSTLDPTRSRNPRLLRPWMIATLSGVFLALAFGARKTSLTAVLPALGMLALSTFPWRARLRTLAWVAVGFAATFGGLTAEISNWYGTPGIRYFLGIEVAGIDPNTTASAEERRSALINGVLPIFRESLPILFLALVGLGASVERLLAAIPRSARWSRAGWFLPLAVVWFAGRFLLAHERPEHFAFALWPFWLVTGATVVILAISARATQPIPDGEFPQSRRVLLGAAGIPLLWLAGTTLLYASWIKFTANYLAEFLPPLVLLAALGGGWLVAEYRRRLPILVLLGALVTWGAYASARSGYVFEHTGTFDRSSLEEAAAVLRREVPPHEPILTAAVAIPVLSGHRVLLDVAHPTHYAYGYIEPHVRNIYMAPVEQMIAAVREVRWVVLERLTAFSYFREYPEIEQFVNDAFEPVAEIENLSNPITILRRRDQIR